MANLVSGIGCTCLQLIIRIPIFYTVLTLKSWTPQMVRDLVNGINIFGLHRWEDVKIAYGFHQSTACLKSYWKYLYTKGAITMKDEARSLTGDVHILFANSESRTSLPLSPPPPYTHALFFLSLSHSLYFFL